MSCRVARSHDAGRKCPGSPGNFSELAVLTRQAILDNARSDAVFRGFSRVLCDLEVDEYRVLPEMIRRAVSKVSAPRILIHIGAAGTQFGVARRQIISALDLDNSIGSVPSDHEIMEGHAREARRLFTVLELNVRNVRATARGEPGGMVIQREVAERMAFVHGAVGVDFRSSPPP